MPDLPRDRDRGTNHPWAYEGPCYNPPVQLADEPKPTPGRRKWPWLLAAVAPICFLALLAWPTEALYDIREIRQPSVTFRGSRVIRFGYFKLNDHAFWDGREYCGEEIRGLCFIDYVEGVKVHRSFGWRLTGRRSNADYTGVLYLY